MTTPEQNKESCREFMQRVFNEHDLSAAEKMIADDFVDRSPMPGMPGDKASTIEMFRRMNERFPDGRSEILDMVASGNKVMVRSRSTATDTNGFMPGMTPTGKTFSMESIDVLTFDQNGQNVEHYGIADLPSVMLQLGLMPWRGGQG
jgi:predicted SnoaL-like aldol condensation-catalyzing enzyme